MWELLLPIFGFLIGTVASMAGIGGGVFIVPLLTLMYGFAPAQAVGTSLTTIIFTSIASAANYSRQKRIYYKTGLILAVTTVPGAYLGAYLTSIIPAQQLGLIFGFFLFFVSLRMLLNSDFSKPKQSRAQNDSRNTPINSDETMLHFKDKLLLGAALGFFAGLASGLLGIGGGVLIVPILMVVMGMPIHAAVATSMFTMIFTSTSGAVQHFSLGNIRPTYAFPLILGTIFGAQLGAYTSKRLSSKNLQIAFGLIVIIFGIQMILKYF
jgi:hypothetical protein